MINGSEPKRSYEKMSKSKYNGVDPAECIAKHGADCTRAHILFSAPVSDVLEWNEEAIVGMERWLNRVWRLINSTVAKITELRLKQQTAPRNISKMTDAEKLVWRTVQRTVVNVTNSLSESYSLNTMISDLIKLTHALEEANESSHQSIRPLSRLLYVETLVKLIAPTAPAVADECWKVIQESKRVPEAMSSVFDTAWPEIDDERIFDVEDIRCAVQIDGKTRFVVDIPGSVIDNQDEIVNLVVGTPDGKTWVGKKMEEASDPPRIIVAPGGRVINFVFKARKPKVDTEIYQ